MYRAEATDEPDALEREAPELEAVGQVIAGRFREVAVIARRRVGGVRFDPGRVGQQGEPAIGLQVVGATVEYGQGHARIGDDILAVLRDVGNQDHRLAATVEAERHDRAEGIAGHGDRNGRQHPVIAAEQEAPRFARGGFGLRHR